MDGFAEVSARFRRPGICPDGLADGVRNLLVTCAGVVPGHRVLVVAENPALGWYDAAIARAVAAGARALGAHVTVIKVAGPEVETDISAVLSRVDIAVFLARIGDHDRFAAASGPIRVMSYARTIAALAGAYGTTDHRAMSALKTAVDIAFARTAAIRITCSAGTDVSGPGPSVTTPADVAVLRFPLGVGAPVPAEAFSGRVVLNGALTPTGNRSYAPSSVEIAGTVHARIAEGRITGFDGESADLAAIRRHYTHVAGLFDIDADAVHSWHAGLHPGTAYPDDPAENRDRWSNSVFTDPAWLHFHTCGAYAPGEICWMVASPTVTLDGVALWQEGRLCPDRVPETRAVLDTHPDLASLFG